MQKLRNLIEENRGKFQTYEDAKGLEKKLRRAIKQEQERRLKLAATQYVAVPELHYGHSMFDINFRLIWFIAMPGTKLPYLNEYGSDGPLFRPLTWRPTPSVAGCYTTTPYFEDEDAAEDLVAALNLGREARQKSLGLDSSVDGDGGGDEPT